MKSATRFWTLVGAGVMMGASLAAPAHAAAPAEAASTAVMQTQRDWHDDDDDWEWRGSYDSRRECREQGRRGENRDWWEEFKCVPDWRRGHRGDWRLAVQEDDDRWGDHDRRGGRGR